LLLSHGDDWLTEIGVGNDEFRAKLERGSRS
jgi:hypothetical protein